MGEMGSKIGSIQAATGYGVGDRQSPMSEAAAPQRAPSDSRPQPGDLRLVIEEDPETGTYVYKTIDRRSGEVIQQLPRNEVLRLREEAGYVAGMVIRTKT